MSQRFPRNVPLLHDGAADALKYPVAPRSVRYLIILFGLVFALLQWGWSVARGTWVEQLVVHEVTVTSAAALVRFLTPQIPARPIGASIKAPGGGLNILNGCEGTEVMFLLMAAFAAVRMPWRHRLAGLILGTGMIFLLNQMRILVLFYSNRADRALFDVLHTAILPAVLVALTAAYFYAVLHYARRYLA
jgi:exosortase/archaeosortase family protein